MLDNSPVIAPAEDDAEEAIPVEVLDAVLQSAGVEDTADGRAWLLVAIGEWQLCVGRYLTAQLLKHVGKQARKLHTLIRQLEETRLAHNELLAHAHNEWLASFIASSGDGKFAPAAELLDAAMPRGGVASLLAVLSETIEAAKKAREAAGFPARKGPVGSRNYPMAEDLVCRLEQAVRHVNGHFTLDPESGKGSIIEVMNRLRPHLLGRDFLPPPDGHPVWAYKYALTSARELIGEELAQDSLGQN